MSKNKQEIRCICSRHPLLAIYGVDKTTKKPFIHVKVYKQSRIYAEMFVSANAELKLRCRDCLRLHNIKIVSDKPLLKEEHEKMELIAMGSVSPYIADHGNDGVR